MVAGQHAGARLVLGEGRPSQTGCRRRNASTPPPRRPSSPPYTVSSGKISLPCGTNAMPDRARLYAELRSSAFPSKATVPDVSLLWPTINLIRLVLPTPLRPSTQVILPASAVRETPRSARRRLDGSWCCGSQALRDNHRARERMQHADLDHVVAWVGAALRLSPVQKPRHDRVGPVCQMSSSSCHPLSALRCSMPSKRRASWGCPQLG